MFDFMDMDFNSGEAGQPVGGPYIPEAADCMRCGMCVGACPTFKLFQTDEETPRRRIRTISKLLLENQPVGDEELRHLNNCLQCRACEPVCPSRMAYGELFDQAQAKLRQPPKRLARLAFRLIEHKTWRKRLMPLLSLYLHSGLRQPVRKTGLPRKLRLAAAEALLAKPALTALKPFYPTTANRRGNVALFTGCVAEQFDRETLLAAIKLLNAIGFDVLVPPQQGCCGAIHQHNGQSAAGLISHNLRVFNALPVDAVIHAATGCGAMLSEYRADDDQEAARLFGGRLADIHEFILRHWPDDLKLKAAADTTLAVHEPCSQRNVLKNQQTVYALLAKIPGLTVVPLADNPLCCGAGGSYMLTHPDNAEALRSLKVRAITASAAQRVVSGNFGCMCFLNAAPELNGQIIQHPIRLLADALN
ncbi:(Fe-S)-binding protein [Methylomonas sp. SURF-2]|uniref:Glycolate oxidase iron-sulfur subunit n=1 Tax=Methylomonas subterranea TaxID=2952225 RepID=A0ABT1TCJ0_9GAMM|nr:(Fe-S)-binding protein [Methylomonas sp. SURF-2]MCQ8102499.1 (Fe-S)-binding protein [Methylomonas sp. SURF-2]